MKRGKKEHLTWLCLSHDLLTLIKYMHFKSKYNKKIKSRSLEHHDSQTFNLINDPKPQRCKEGAQTLVKQCRHEYMLEYRMYQV